MSLAPLLAKLIMCIFIKIDFEDIFISCRREREINTIAK